MSGDQLDSSGARVSREAYGSHTARNLVTGWVYVRPQAGPGAHRAPQYQGGTYCRDPYCRNTNWGGYGRTHLRFSDCPVHR